jgi:serralysin
LVDIPGDASTTATLSVGSTVTGSVEVVDDHDWYKITLTAGQSVTVSLTGITLTDTYLNIRDSSGNIIFSNDDVSDGNLSSQVSFSAPSTGTYYIDVSAWHDPTGAYQGTGTYQVSVQPYSPPPLATNDQIANQLVSGYWGGDSHHFNVAQGGTITVNISTLNAGEQTLARAALQEWTDIIGVRFQEVLTSSAQIRFDNTEDTSGNPIAATDARWSNGIETSAHVHISSSWVNRYGTSLYSYSMQTYVHEIGHALGLGHAGNYNNTATYPYDALFQNDAWSTSIMSYFDQQQNTYFGGRGFTVNFAVTPMAADILAMQQLYGLSTTTRTGDTTYGFNSNADRDVFDFTKNENPFLTIYDAGGHDTLDLSGFSHPAVLDLREGHFSTGFGAVPDADQLNAMWGTDYGQALWNAIFEGRTNIPGFLSDNIGIAYGTIIEDGVTGSGNDRLIGNDVANHLDGGAGNDVYTGNGGADIFAISQGGYADTITDFQAGVDKLDLSAFHIDASHLSYSGNALLVDINGDHIADLAVISQTGAIGTGDILFG